MVTARVSDEYIKFSLMYTTDNIFNVVPIKHLVNQDLEPTTPQKLETGTKPSVSNIRVLIFPCVTKNDTAHVDTKALNMCHQSQICFLESLLKSHNIKKGTSSTYLVHGK